MTPIAEIIPPQMETTGEEIFAKSPRLDEWKEADVNQAKDKQIRTVSIQIIRAIPSRDAMS